MTEQGSGPVRPTRLRRGAPVLCGGAVPAGDLGNGVTGVPIASGPVSWVLLTVVIGLLVVATLWWMRRWSESGPAPSVRAADTPAAAVTVADAEPADRDLVLR